MVCLGLASDRDNNGNKIMYAGVYSLANCHIRCTATSGCNFMAHKTNDNQCHLYKTFTRSACVYNGATGFRTYTNDGIVKFNLEANYDITMKRDVAVGYGPFPLCYTCVSSKANPSYHTGAAQTIEWKVTIQQVMNCDTSLVLKTSGLPAKTVDIPYLAGVADYQYTASYLSLFTEADAVNCPVTSCSLRSSDCSGALATSTDVFFKSGSAVYELSAK